MHGLCHKCAGISAIVVSVLVFANAYTNTAYLDWPRFIAILLLLKGVLSLMKPHCGCITSCAACEPAAEKKPAKKK